jgi:hypothetical protein
MDSRPKLMAERGIMCACVCTYKGAKDSMESKRSGRKQNTTHTHRLKETKIKIHNRSLGHYIV